MSPRALPVLALVLGTACAPDESPVFGERVWTGQHLEVWATDETRICAGSYEALDRHAELLNEEVEMLGVQTYAKRYRYYWLSQQEFESAEPCPDGARGCVRREGGGPSIYTFGHLLHEVTHAEFASSHHSFIDEGLAVMFGDPDVDRDVPEDRPAISDTVDASTGRQLDFGRYRQAGSFVRAVEDLYPNDYLRALLQSQRDDDFQQLRERARATGVDVSAAVELYESEEEGCFVDATRIALLECAVEPTPWADGRWSSSGSIDCDASDTLGPSTRYPKRWTVRSVDVPEAGEYTAWFETDDALIATMVYCDAPWCGTGFRQSSNRQTFLPGWLAPLELEAGRYWFRIEQDMDDLNPGRFELNLIPGWHDEDPRE